MAFSFDIDQEGNFPVICLIGNLLERYEAEELLEEINEILLSESKKIILDMGELEYVNSSGLNVILTIFTRVRNVNGELIICQVNDKLKKLLVITKLNDVIKQTGSREEAASLLTSEIQ